MALMRILLLSRVFLSFGQFVSCAEKYEVKIFKSITIIPNDGNISYLQEYPVANTDQYTEERRLELCQKGFHRVLEHRRGRKFQFIENKKPEKLETYVLVELPTSENLSMSSFEDDSTSSSSDERDGLVNVYPAYQCPTIPPMYIHIHYEWKKRSSIWVMFKAIGESFNVKDIKQFRLLFLEDIREARAEEAEKVSQQNITNSVFDDEKLPQEQRLQLCKRVMNMAPEMAAYFTNEVKSRTLKYYTLFKIKRTNVYETEKEHNLNQETKSDENPFWAVPNSPTRNPFWNGKNSPRRSEAVQNSESGSKTDTETYSGSIGDSGSSTVDNNLTIMKAFTCPTVPEIHINVTCLSEKENTLWALVKENEIKEHPALGITRYELIIANSIRQIYGKHDNPSKKWQKDHLPLPQNYTELLNSSEFDNDKKDEDHSASIYKLEKFGQIFDTIMEKRGKKDAAIDVDKLTKEQRLSICEKAMKTIFGENVQFTKDDTGRSQYYRIYENEVYESKDRHENSNRRKRYETEEVVRAFSCPTQPIAHIRLATEDAENIAQVIISVRNLTFALMQFK